MEHKPKLRPALPGSTPTPAFIRNNSVSNVYASLSAAASHANNYETTNDDQQLQDATAAEQNKVKSLQKSNQFKSIQKIISKFPFEIRESVTSVVNMSLSSAESLQQELEFHNKELLYLRQELSKKNQDTLTLKKTCGIYQERVRILEEDINNLKDNVESRQKYMTKNRGAMSKLAATNRMLIDSLNALDSTGNKLQPLHGAGGLDTNPGTPAIAAPEISFKNTGRKLSPIRRASPAGSSKTVDSFSEPGRLSPPSPTKSNTGNNPTVTTVAGPSQFQRDKLRESLLKVTREHYRSLKNSEVLEAKVDELRGLLRAAEQQNRKLKSELDEISSIKNRDVRTGKYPEEQKSSSSTSDSPRVVNSNVSIKVRKFGYIDERFNALIARNAIDPIDGIMHMRRILAHIATAPNNLNFNDMVAHIVSKESLKIFDSDIICLYISSSGNGDAPVILKYTLRALEPTVFSVHSSNLKSIAADTILNGKVARLNSVHGNPAFNTEIDGSPGVITKRILALPLFNTDTNEIFGAIHIINKSQGRPNDAFTEVDELFGLVYADQASLLLSSCYIHDRVSQRSHLLEFLLESSTALFTCVPEANSLAATKAFQSGDLLATMENICKTALKCPNARAFLISDFIGMEPGHLVFLQNNNMHSISKFVKHHLVTTAPVHSGIAGHVVRTKVMYSLEDSGFDPYLNPLVDVDPIVNPMVTVPIVDLHSNIIGCLQFVCGPNSPKMRISGNPSEKKNILFPQAAQWLTHQIASPLQYLMSYVGKPANRPIGTPTSISIPTGSSALAFLPDAPAISALHPIENTGHGHHRKKHHHHHHHSARISSSEGSTKGSSVDFVAIPLESIKAEDGDFDGYVVRPPNPSVQAGAVNNNVAQIGSSNANSNGSSNSNEGDSWKDYDKEIADLKAKIDEEKALTNLYGGTVKLLEEEIETLQTEVVQLRNREQSYKTIILSHENNNKQSSQSVSELQKEVAALKESAEKSNHANLELLQRQKAKELQDEQNRQDEISDFHKQLQQKDSLLKLKETEIEALIDSLSSLKEAKEKLEKSDSSTLTQLQDKLRQTTDLLQVKEDEITQITQNLSEQKEATTSLEKLLTEEKKQNEHLQKHIQLLEASDAERGDSLRSQTLKTAMLEAQIEKLQDELEKSKIEAKHERITAAEKMESYKTQIQELLEANASLTNQLEEIEEKNKVLTIEVNEAHMNIPETPANGSSEAKPDNDNDSYSYNGISEASPSRNDAYEELHRQFMELQHVKESEYQSYTKDIEGLQLTIRDLREELQATKIQAQEEEDNNVQERLSLQREQDHLFAANIALSNEATKLRASVAEKDSVIAILQAQLLKMANQKIDEVNQEMSQTQSQQSLSHHDAIQEDGEVRKGNWILQFDNHGNEFWVNTITGVSAWEIPADDDISYGGSAGGSAGSYNIEL